MARWADYGRKKLEGEGRAFPLLTFPLSLGYEALVRLRNRSYDSGCRPSRRLSVPVISVGNITLGGTGKTPMVIFLVRTLKELGFRPAVISRGYGGDAESSLTVVSDGHAILSTAREAGDEPLLLARSLGDVPVLSGRRRVDVAARAITGFDVNVIVMDDAFQHRSVARDLDILLVDGQRPFGNGCLLPGGILREPLSSLRRADLVVVTDGTPGTLDSLVESLAPGMPVLYAERRPRDLLHGSSGTVLPLEYLQDKRVVAFAGIASPERFRETLSHWCGSLERFLSYPDHYRYDDGAIARIRSAASSADVIVTTEKDGVRLLPFEEFYKKLLLFRIEMRPVPSPDRLVALLRDNLALPGRGDAPGIMAGTGRNRFELLRKAVE